MEVCKKGRKTQRKGRFGKERKVGSVRRVQGGLGSCLRLILVALVLRRFGCRSLIRRSNASVRDALEW